MFDSPSRADHFAFVTGGLGLFTLVVALFMFLRPARRASRMGPADAAQIRALLARHGEQDSLAYFTLRTTRASSGRRPASRASATGCCPGVCWPAVIPIGDPEAWPGRSTRSWTRRRHAWVPAVIGCGELELRSGAGRGPDRAGARRRGHRRRADFSLQGRSMRNVRQMVPGSAGRLRGRLPPDRRHPAREVDADHRQADSGAGARPSAASRWRSAASAAATTDVRDRHGTRTACSRAILHFVPWGTTGSRWT